MELTANFFVPGCDAEFMVTFDYEPFIPAKTDGPPEDCYPAEGGKATITAVLLNGDDLLDVLSGAVLNNLTEQAKTWAGEQ